MYSTGRLYRAAVLCVSCEVVSRIVESDGDGAPPPGLARLGSPGPLTSPATLPSVLTPPVLPPLPQGPPGNLLLQ